MLVGKSLGFPSRTAACGAGANVRNIQRQACRGAVTVRGACLMAPTVAAHADHVIQPETINIQYSARQVTSPALLLSELSKLAHPGFI